MNAKTMPAQVALNINKHVSLAQAAKLLATSGVALSRGTTVPGNASVNIEIRGAANKPALNGTVSANKVQMSDKDIALPVQIPSVTLSVGFDLTPKLPSDAVVQMPTRHALPSCRPLGATKSH